MDCSPPGSSVRGISQARILDGLSFPTLGDLPESWMESESPALARGFFTTEPPRDGLTPVYWIFTQWRCAFAAKSLQSCPTLCDPIDGSPPGSPVPGILQARTLKWAAIAFSIVWKWKVKSESEVAQSCPTRSDPMDGSLPGSSIHGIF